METDCTNYNELYQWSVDNIGAFWAELWRFCRHQSLDQLAKCVIDDPNKMPGAQWFTGSRLNFAENLLRYRDDQNGPDIQGRGHRPQKS